LLIFTALIGLITLRFIRVSEPEATAVTAMIASLMALSGILFMGAMLFYLRALQPEEASALAPFFQASPLFGYALGCRRNTDRHPARWRSLDGRGGRSFRCEPVRAVHGCSHAHCPWR
jgi:hypothetical protein